MLVSHDPGCDEERSHEAEEDVSGEEHI